MRNRTSNLRIPRSDTLPLSHIDPTVSEVHMTPVLHAAKIKNVDSVIFEDRTCHNSLKLSKADAKDVSFRNYLHYKLILLNQIISTRTEVSLENYPLFYDFVSILSKLDKYEKFESNSVIENGIFFKKNMISVGKN